MAITLKAARVNKNLTQKQAAAKLGISDNALWN
jgi:transcriptional regulator with XRE-family HTH domain